MTEPKTRERLKGSNFGTYTWCFKIPDFITATSFKIKVFQRLMTTGFLKHGALI